MNRTTLRPDEVEIYWFSNASSSGGPDDDNGPDDDGDVDGTDPMDDNDPPEVGD